MKIKTITCHDVYNVGASLQAYALAEYLHQQGHEVEIINYKPPYLRHYELFGVRNPRFNRPLIRELYQIAKFPSRVISQFDPRKKAFDMFTQEYLPVTVEVYESNEELKENPPDADVYIAGSDQIWNPLFENGKDPAFFLDFVPEGKIKASYSASFAVDDIPSELAIQTGKWLNKIDYISVRERSGVKIVEKFAGKESVQVLDPVFLLPAATWEKLSVRPQIKERYLFVYDFDNNKTLKDFAICKAKESGFKIVSWFPLDYADIVVRSAGPKEFIGLLESASYVVSNSFHATAFSLIFHIPFAVFDRNENINERMRDLLEIAEVQSINDSWNSVEAEKKLSVRRKLSEKYLNMFCT